MQEGRRFGRPRTDAERKKRHKSLYGTSQLPPRGTGLTYKEYQFNRYKRRENG